MTKILVVEDDTSISNLIKMNLQRTGFQATCVYDGLSAADLLEEKTFDLILLDVMLPGADGYELMDFIRPLEIPVIFLTAKSEVGDRVKGLRLGADDYLTKPFEIAELLARVESVLRRYHKTEQTLVLGDIEVNLRSHSVKKGGEPVLLTPKEYEVLILFLQNKNVALFRDFIYERVWGGEYMGDSRTVELHVQRMRKKMGLEKQIVTVYKVGYRLEC